MNRLARLTRAAALVAALVFSVSACTTTGADEGTRSADQQGYVGSKGLVTQIAPADRKAQPSIAGQSLDGRPLSTADFPGKVVVVNVWASWCTPCREEAPALQEASVATAEVAQFVAINTQEPDPAPAQAFVRAQKISYPSIFDPDGKTLLAFSRTMPPKTLPATLVIDTHGRLAARILGPITKLTLVTIINEVAAT